MVKEEEEQLEGEKNGKNSWKSHNGNGKTEMASETDANLPVY